MSAPVCSAFLSWFGAINLVDLPLECVSKIHFRSKMLFYTLIPTAAFIGLQVAARYYPHKRGVIHEVAFAGVFLLYPGCSSIIFSALSCVEFDDGSARATTCH